jgi:hypothetical protein
LSFASDFWPLDGVGSAGHEVTITCTLAP